MAAIKSKHSISNDLLMDNTALQFLSDIIYEFTRDIDKNPGFADSYFTRGILKYCLGDINGAFNDWSVAINLGCKDTILLLKHLTLSELPILTSPLPTSL
jgi:hypothetical protein